MYAVPSGVRNIAASVVPMLATCLASRSFSNCLTSSGIAAAGATNARSAAAS